MGISYFLLNVVWLQSANKNGCGIWRKREVFFFKACLWKEELKNENCLKQGPA